MNGKLSFFFVCFSLFCARAAAQPDTILLGYPAPGDDNSYINKICVLSDNRIVFAQGTSDNTFQAFVVDANGEIVFTNDLDQVDGYKILSNLHIIEDTARYIFLGSAAKDSQEYFIIYSTDSTLENAKLVDTVQLEKGIQLLFENMRFNSHKDHWETIGWLRRISNAAVVPEYFYASLNPDYTFKRFKKFKTKHGPSYVFDFRWLNDVGRYVFCSFSQKTILVDEDMNWLYESPLWFNYFNFNTILDFQYFAHQVNNTVFGLVTGPAGPYALALAWLDINNDSIALQKVTPLNNTPVGVLSFGAHLRRDRDGNYLVAGTDNIPFSTTGPANMLKVIKYDPDINKIWEFSYKDDKGFIIRNMEIDQNNDIVLVGQAWNLYGDAKTRGFLMKVYSHGTLSSYQEAPDTGNIDMRISPNPTSTTLCVRTETEQAQLLRLWGAGGQLALTEKIDASTHCVELPVGFPAGVYAAELLFADGRRVAQKLVVEKK